MHLFLRNTTYFFLALLACIAINTSVNLCFFNTRHQHLPKEINTLLLGDCRVTNDLNPALIDSSVNMGISGEREAITFLKLQRLAADNPHLKKVVLQLSPTFFGTMLSKVPINEQYYELIDLPFPKKIDAQRAFLLLLKGYGLRPQFSKDCFWVGKGFVARNGVVAADHKQASQQKKALALNYTLLDEVVDFCEYKKLSLLLAQSPMLVVSQAEQKWNRQCYSKVAARYVGRKYVRVLLNDSLAGAQSFYCDKLHLNNAGATYYSTWVNKNLVRSK